MRCSTLFFIWVRMVRSVLLERQRNSSVSAMGVSPLRMLHMLVRASAL